MVRDYNPFEFDSPDPDRVERIKREVEIVTTDHPKEIWDEGGQREGTDKEGADKGRADQGGANKGRADQGGADQGGADQGDGRSAEEIEAAKEAEERRIERENSLFWQFISGNWMILKGVTGTYRYLLIITVTLFFSVVSIFVTFHLSEQLTHQSQRVQLLHERSLEYQRARFNSTSHSAISRELERRGIPLYDLHESKTIIE